MRPSTKGSKISQLVGDLLIRHPRVRKHPCAWVFFQDCTRAPCQFLVEFNRSDPLSLP